MPGSKGLLKNTNRDRFSLRGKGAILTGGAGILGQGFSAGLARHGANVAVVDINLKAAQETAHKIAKEYGVKTIGIGCDVSSPSSVASMVKRAVKAIGEVHILHNSAASKSKDLDAFFAPFEKYSLAEWRKIMSVNVDGMFLVAQAVGAQMIRQGRGGSVIQTASIYGIMGPDHRIYEGSFYLGRQISSPAVYSASKGAVVALTKYLATYWAEKGIRVNTITPGGVKSGQNETFMKKYSDRIPMGRMAEADELVGALVYLASDASSYVTGHNLVVDGGLNAW
jgi:NAD(P)-dependent dehydrogenase (short-subunit alcohol dehydrogenase family)